MFPAFIVKDLFYERADLGIRIESLEWPFAMDVGPLGWISISRILGTRLVGRCAHEGGWNSGRFPTLPSIFPARFC